MAQEIDHRAVTVVADPIAVLAHPVQAGDIAQVLDRSGAQQGLPGVVARRRPVGDVQRQVVVQRLGPLDVVAVAREHREPQVVADQRTDPPTLPFHDQPVTAGRVALVFVGVTEQVALVIVRHTAIGSDEQQAVVHAVAVADLHAAGDGGAQLRRLRTHPRESLAFHRLGGVQRLVGEAAGEGLRQQHQVGGVMQRRQQAAVVLAVGGRVVPHRGALDQRDAQVGHRHHSLPSRSIAASSVASFFAKHSRARRCPTGGEP